MVMASLSLACYIPGINKREQLAWVLIFAAIFWAGSTGKAEILVGAFEKGAVYGSLMVAISFVQIPARRSIVAQTVATRISRQGQLGTSWTAHLLAHAAGASLNLSGLIILQAAVQKAMLGAQTRLIAATVYLRGFSAAPVWSPYSYFTPLVLAAFPTLAWWQLLCIGIFIAALLLCLSIRIPPESLDALCDKEHLEAPGTSARIHQQHVMWRWGAFAGFFISIIGLMSFSSLGSMTVIVVALPVLALLWGSVESLMAGSCSAFLHGVSGHVSQQIPVLRTEILALTAAGMLSYVIAKTSPTLGFLLPAQELGMGGALLQTSLVFIAITALTWLGINPVLFIAPLATLVANPIGAPFSWSVALMILCCAWALFPTISPFAAATLVTAREAGVDAQTLVSKVNARYNQWALAACWLLVAATVVLTHISPLFY